MLKRKSTRVLRDHSLNKSSKDSNSLKLYCKEAIDVNKLLLIFKSDHKEDFMDSSNNMSELKKPIKPKQTGNKLRKSYVAYTNKEKIEFLLLANEIGCKKAAMQRKICWSTAKAWLKKDEALHHVNKSYVKILEGELL